LENINLFGIFQNTIFYIILHFLLPIRGPAEKQIMEPDEKATEPEDEVYGCISSEQTQILSKEDERLVKLINEKAKDKAYRMAFPKRDIKPIPEHGETKIFCYAFPWLFPGGFGDIQDARNTKIQPADWAHNLLYYEDGRFATDKLWSFFTLNYIYRRRNQSQSQFFCNNMLGSERTTIEQMQDRIAEGDTSCIDKLLYFSKNIPGSSAYWRGKKSEVYSWINHHVERGRGAPTVFLTLSCAEYFWPDLKRLLEETIYSCEGKKVDLDLNHNELNKALNNYCIVVQEFFHLRVDAFLKTIGFHVFGIKHYWGRFEFAKSRGQIHLHLLGIVEDAAKPDGIYEQLWKLKGNEGEQAKVLGDWARQTFDMTANLDENTTISSSEESPCKERCCQTNNVKQDQASLCNFCQMHKCNDYCLRTRKEKKAISDINPDKQKQKVRQISACKNIVVTLLTN
jgi:hypothetical protein